MLLLLLLLVLLLSLRPPLARRRKLKSRSVPPPAAAAPWPGLGLRLLLVVVVVAAAVAVTWLGDVGPCRGPALLSREDAIALASPSDCERNVLEREEEERARPAVGVVWLAAASMSARALEERSSSVLANC